MGIASSSASSARRKLSRSQIAAALAISAVLIAALVVLVPLFLSSNLPGVADIRNDLADIGHILSDIWRDAW